MAPVPQHRLVRRSTDADGRYAIIFAVLGSFIVIVGVLWGYVLPRLRRKYREPVQTRYNCLGEKQNTQPDLNHDFELPVIFPPHPAVVIPLDKKQKKQTSNGQSHTHNLSSIPVYDPRTQSPFPNTPSAGSCRPVRLGIPDRKTSRQTTLHAARLQQSTFYSSSDVARANTFCGLPNTLTRDANVGQRQQKSTKSGRNPLFVARSAGVPPPKRKPTRPASEKSQHPLATLRVLDAVSASAASTTRAADHQTWPRHDENLQVDNNLSGSGKIVGSGTKRPISIGTEKSLHTPGQAGSNVRKFFETPSSPETAFTSRVGSSPNHLQFNFTPLTVPGSAVVQTGGNSGVYPGISKLVPSRRLRKYCPTFRLDDSPCTDSESEAKSCLSAEDPYGSTHMRIRHRPVSAPPSSSRRAARVDRELAGDMALPELDSNADIQLHPTVSLHSSRSSVDSLTLYPRPLTFRRTIGGQSPLVSPTPLGRHLPNASSPEVSMRHKFANIRPVTRGKTPSSKRRIRISTVFHPPGRQPAKVAKDVKSTSHKLGNPFMDRLGLARMGSNVRRSSVASLSTLKIPKSFRQSNSRAGSSIYSRDTKGVSVPPSPGLRTEVATSLQSLPEPSPLRRAISFDETLLNDLDWTLPCDDDIDVKSRHVVAASSNRKEEADPRGDIRGPQTPTFASEKSTANTETPNVGTASSNTFGAKMAVPKISIARSSDDVFGGGLSTRGRDPNIITGTGISRTFKSVRVMGSKLSQEDLVKYGGRTAPGGVEWF